MNISEQEEFEFRIRAEQEAQAGDQAKEAPLITSDEPWTDAKTAEFLLRQAALTGKAAYTGLSSIPAMAGEVVALPYNMLARGANTMLGTNFQESHPSRATSYIGEKLYPIQPENSGERLSSDVISSVGGAAGMMGAGRAIGGNIGGVLSQSPMLQTAGAATSGLASGATREAGGGQGQQLAAGFVGGLAPSVVAATGNMLGMAGSSIYRTATAGSRSGSQREAEKVLRDLAGDERIQIQNALKEGKSYVPFSPPTSAEVLAQSKLKTKDVVGAGFVKLQEDLAKTVENANLLQTIPSKRIDTYSKLVERIAGTPEKMAAAVAHREAVTKPLYEASDNMMIKVTPRLKEFIEGMPKEAIASAKRAADADTLASGGITKAGVVPEQFPVIFGDDAATSMRGEAISGKYLGYILKGIKDYAYRDGVSPGEGKALQNLAKEFEKTVYSVNKPLEIANQKFAELSTPISRMEVGRILADKIQSASQKETTETFLRAADDAAKTIKTATGFSKYKGFEDVLTKKEIAVIRRVSDDMERLLESRRMAQKTVLPQSRNLAEADKIAAPNIFWRPSAIANWVMSKIGKEATPEVNKRLATILADPKMLNKVLEGTPKDRMPEMQQFMKQFFYGGTAGTMPVLSQEQEVMQ